MPSILDYSARLHGSSLDISKGAASSTVLNRSGVTIQTLTFDGYGHVEATSRCTHFCFDLRGHYEAIDWRTAGKRSSRLSRPGSLYLLPSGADFTVDTRDGSDTLALLVSDETLGLAAGEHARSNMRVKEVIGGEDPLLLASSRALAREGASSFPNGILFWTSLTDRIVERLVLNYLPTSPTPVGGTLSSRALGRINDFIEGSLNEAITLDDLAQVAAQSRFHFQRTFRRSLGLTPHRYVMLVRLKRAVSLVRNGDLSLAAIAADTGFVDQSHMSRWVREVYGVTPSAMRGH